MRPSSGGDALPAANPRSRKSSVADHLAAHNGPSSHVPTTFFLRSEEEIGGSLSSPHSTEPASKQRDSTFGVHSLADTLENAFGQESRTLDSEPTVVAGADNIERERQRHSTQSSPKSSSRQTEEPRSSPLKKLKKKTSNQALSASLTPLNFEAQSPIPPSAMPSTPKSVSLQSLKLSDEESGADDVASQAITSSGEEDEEETAGQSEPSSFPQLVMPSIQMPTRRPFTDKGKAMGRLKVLVAGESGMFSVRFIDKATMS